MLDDRGPNCEKATIVPGNNQFRIVGSWERYWRHWVTDTLGQIHFIPCGGPKSTCKMCAFVNANWESNPEFQQWKAGTASLFNVIDRRDNWCATNKHTKVLCQWKSEIGVGPMIFEELKEVVNINGPWNGKDGKGGDWDVIITKSGSGKQGTAYKAQATREKIEQTEEEKKYEKYDLKTLLPALANPEEVQELINNLTGKTTAETTPPDALTIEDLKVEPQKVETEVAKPSIPSVPKLSKKVTPKQPEPLKKKNSQKCETNDCKGTLEYDDTDKEVTCPVCKETYGLEPATSETKEANPFDN